MTVQTFAKDFDELEVGERFTTEDRAIAMTDVMAFAELTGDTHPQHTDAEWARDSLFGEQIAHGLLVLSAAAGLVPFDPDRVVALRKVSDAVFKAPVKIGDTVHVEGQITKARQLDDDHGLVECRWKVLNQDAKLVLRVAVEVVWRRGSIKDSAEPAASDSVLI